MKMHLPYNGWIAAIVGVALPLLLLAAVLPARDAEEGTAKGGSPLYGIVVRDAVARLAGSGRERAPAAAAQEPCPDCGQIHGPPRRRAADDAAARGHGALAEQPAAPPHAHARRPSTPAQPEAQTPRYVYCAQCRVYHRHGDEPHPSRD